ncbi:hypothetical protein ABMA27_010797 [Loxostege sticticalis]|uniref:Vinculin n=1 Tax=Loxostege sticticalis TaxID=481309 RepID=A0ABR3H4P1_LOXSC
MPVIAPKGRTSTAELRQKLYDSAAQLNAAIAALVAATADREKPDYVAADNAMNTINQLLPQIVKDTKTVSSGEDEKTRQEMLAELRALCDAARGICDSAGAASNEDLNSSAAKFASASGKLVYVFNPRSDQDKDNEILDLSQSACEKASQLLNDVYQLAAEADDEAGSQLDIAGSKVALAANALLTTAQLTAPCMQDPRCQASLVSSANALSSANQRLAAAWLPVLQDPRFEALGARIQKGRAELDEELERLKKACHVTDSANEVQQKTVSRPVSIIRPANQDPRHLQYVNAAVAADSILQQAEKELSKPIVAPKAGHSPADLQSKLADSLARLNAAIAALLQATADRDKPDYDTAEQSIQVINELMPQVVKDTKALSASKDEKDRNAMLDDLKAMCEATRGICASVRDGNHENLNYNAVRFGSNSGKLFYVISPRTNQTKEHQLIDLSSQACEKATMLLTQVYQLAAEVGGDAGSELDACGSKTADAAKTLLATAQLTAPSIHEQQCQASMLSAANALSSSAKHLASVWAAPAQDPKHTATCGQLNQGWKELDDAVERIKAALHEDVAVKSPTRRAPPPPPPKRASSHEHRLSKGRDFNQEFLDRMRFEESQNAGNALAVDAIEAKHKRKTDDEKALHQEFIKNIDTATQKIRKAEDDVNRRKTDDEKALHQEFVKNIDTAAQKIRKAEDDINREFVKNIDTAAQKIWKAEDDVNRRKTDDEKALHQEFVKNIDTAAQKIRKAEDDVNREFVKNIDTATQKIRKAEDDVNRRKTDDEKALHQEFVKNIDTATQKIRKAEDDVNRIYSARDEVIPALSVDQTLVVQKQMEQKLALAGVAASNLVASNHPDSIDLEVASKSTATLSDLMPHIVQDAKLLRGSLNEEERKRFVADIVALFEATKNMLESAKEDRKKLDLSAVEFGNKSAKLLYVVSTDVDPGQEKEASSRLAVLGAGSAAHLDSAQMQALCRAGGRCAEAATTLAYTAKLVAPSIQNPECNEALTKASNDLSSHLQSYSSTWAPLEGTPSINELRTEAESLEKLLEELRRDLGSGKLVKRRMVERVEVENTPLRMLACVVLEEAKKRAESTNTPPEQRVKYAKYANELGQAIKQLDLAYHRCRKAQHNISVTSGECSLLHINAASMLLAISTQDYKTALRADFEPGGPSDHHRALRQDGRTTQDLPMKICKIKQYSRLYALTCHVRNACGTSVLRFSSQIQKRWHPFRSALGHGRLVAAASRACAGASSDLPPAFTAYVDDVRARTDLSDEAERDLSKAHLRKVLGLLKTLTMTAGRHVATWQKLGHPETAELTGQILQELDSHQNHLNATKGKVQSSALSEVDMNKLLFPTDIKVQGDQKQISDKLQQCASKLSTMTSTILQSAHSPHALTRSAHAAADAAAGLAAHAHALRTDDLAQSQKIDEATKEMSLHTYNVLKTADMVSQEPNNIASRRRLLDACRMLNDAINKLVRTTTPSNKLHRECGELTRNLQLQASLLQSTPQPACAMPYTDCVEALQNQSDVIQKLNNSEPMSRSEFSRTLSYVGAAVCNSTEYAAQCAYLLSIADQNKEVATEGFIDTSRIQSLSEAVQDTCHRIIRTDVEQAMAEEAVLTKQIQDLQQAVVEARDRTTQDALKEQLTAASADIDDAAGALCAAVNQDAPDRARLTTFTLRLLDSVKAVDSIVEGASVAPEVSNLSPEAKARVDDVLKNSRALNNNMIALIRDVKASDDQDPMTWVTFGTSRKAVLDAFEALVNSIKENGKRAGVLESSHSDLEEDADQPKRSYVQVQLDLANKWLKRPTAKADMKSAGETSARNIIQLGEQMAEDFKGNEREEMLQLTQESKALLADCLKKYDSEKASALMERLKELRKNIERGVVTRVVEDFLEGEEPLADLDVLADIEKDETQRQFLLERKIAELLAHLRRVTKTARVVADAGSGGPSVKEDLIKCSDQTELLAPMLVKAAQQRVTSPDDKAAIEHYQKLLAQYAESLANVRNLCDQAVDPMDFVQTAGETMQRMREDTHDNDPQKCAYASTAITKLANRVINVSLSSNDVRKDPELQKLLKEAKEKLKATVPPPNARPSRVPDWKATTAEILRTTGEVESVLGGEMIFNKQQGTDQPIFAAARDLHTAVREWSARDNDIVAVAKRMAVLMAKLSGYMNTDRKRELLATSKSIVTESHEVAELARKLAHECTDVRIKTNLLQCCERIPTISGQLKMLATVKGSSLGHQGLKDDQEDMITLVGNAQNLMLSVQEVVKAAASASVKIASQRGGPRMRWVRKNFY